MVAIRNSALKLLALGLLTYGAAFAQVANLQCVVSATPATVRAEGKAELMGDIEYECTRSNGVAPGEFVYVNILVELDVPVTNNINFNGNGARITDAVLTINDNNCITPDRLGDQFDCPVSPYQDPQFGELLGDNVTVNWNGVRVPFPGEGGNPDITRIRMNSIRGNAASLGIPVSGTFEINTFLDSQPPTLLELDRASVTVARTRVGLIQDGVDPVSGLQCIDIGGDDQDNEAVISFHEGFASAFKTIGVPSFVPGTEFWESGYYAPGSNNGAGASQATQFRVSFTDIPSLVNVSAPITVLGDGTSGGSLVLTLVGNNCGTGGSVNVTPDINGNAGLTYNVCDNDPLSIEYVDMVFTVDWDVANPPAVGIGTLGVSFWPLNGPDVASNSAPEPRFVDTSDPENFLNVEKCVTTLLFPFVTNQSGFDTGLAISNTSDDWGLSNALPQDGNCEIHYIGTDTAGVGPDDDITTSVVEAGDQAVWLLSGGGSHGLVGAPDFQGYVFAACEFQYAHGYAFITDGFAGGIPALAQGYLALVVPADRRISNTIGESLGH